MKKLITVLFLSAIPLFGVFAQLTSSAIEGKATSDTGEELIGVVIQATHVPTGTKYATTTDLNGLYQIRNLIPGGPYTVNITYLGYKSIEEKDVYLTLGNTAKADFKMVEESKTLGEVVISAPADQKTGAGTSISKEQIRSLPTLSRSITDFTRLTPQAANNSFNGTSFRYNNVSIDGAINNDAIGFAPSLGGQGGTSAMPGSSTRTNSISLDAIDQIQVQISPYDIKMGNFTGGSINAVTRRGTNEVQGSVYAFGRSAGITGPDNVTHSGAMPAGYYSYQTGFRVGLPIIKDKLFMFMNYEHTQDNVPVFYGAGQNGSPVSTALMTAIQDSLNSTKFMNQASKNDPTPSVANGNLPALNNGAGSINLGNFSKLLYNQSQSNKLFARFDWNINKNHQLTYRINYIPSSATNLDPSATIYQAPDYNFTQNNVQISNVAELKSQFGKSFSNSLIVGYTNIHDYRDPTVGGQFNIAPEIQINGVGNGPGFTGTGQLYMGSNREAGVFNMRQQTYEFTDNLTFYKGKHTFTLGTHNEFYNINYDFINSWNGRILYNSPSAFFANEPARIRAFYNIGDNSRDYVNDESNTAAKFNINMLSVYAQDDWKALDNLKISLGLRADMPVVPTDPLQNQSNLNAYEDNYNSKNNNNGNGPTYSKPNFNDVNGHLFNQPLISPRLGVNWDVKGDQSIVVRGGSGLFTGRIPFAWLGYAYYNNGVTTGAYDYKPSGALPVEAIATNPTTYQTYGNSVLGKTNTTELDLVANNFKMPQNWRSNLAVDIKLPGNYKLTLEAIYTKVIYDVLLQNINLKDSVRYANYDVNHLQPIYQTGYSTANHVSNAYSNVYLLSNTNQGYRYSLTAQISKTYNFGLNFMAAYTYGKSMDIMNGIRNSPESGWQLNPALSPNSPQLGISNFNIPHRIVATVGYQKVWNKSFTSHFSLVYTGQSGSPFTYGMIDNAALTKTGQQIELAYIPTVAELTNPNDPNFFHFTANSATGQTAAQQAAAFNNYIQNNPYLNSRRGQFTERNGAQTPWNNQLDFRFMQDYNFYSGVSKDPEAPAGLGKKHTIQFTWDIINLTNLIDPNWGWNYFVPNTFNSTVDIGLTPTYTQSSNSISYNFTSPTSTYSKDLLNSRWQMQLGIRYIFN